MTAPSETTPALSQPGQPGGGPALSQSSAQELAVPPESPEYFFQLTLLMSCLTSAAAGIWIWELIDGARFDFNLARGRYPIRPGTVCYIVSRVSQICFFINWFILFRSKSGINCTAIYRASGMFMYLTLVAASAVFTVRAVSAWNHAYYIIILLSALLIAQVGTIIRNVLQIHAMRAYSPLFGTRCTMTSTQHGLVWQLSFDVAFDTVICLLTVVRLRRMARHHEIALLKIVQRDVCIANGEILDADALRATYHPFTKPPVSSSTTGHDHAEAPEAQQQEQLPTVVPYSIRDEDDMEAQDVGRRDPFSLDIDYDEPHLPPKGISASSLHCILKQSWGKKRSTQGHSSNSGNLPTLDETDDGLPTSSGVQADRGKSKSTLDSFHTSSPQSSTSPRLRPAQTLAPSCERKRSRSFESRSAAAAAAAAAAPSMPAAERRDPAASKKKILASIDSALAGVSSLPLPVRVVVSGETSRQEQPHVLYPRLGSSRSNPPVPEIPIEYLAPDRERARQRAASSSKRRR
ncbi:hypothetical protein OC835_007023 [Tilletia horrida]|nr:hypothetical protein OC835_007023 [Tilletia horrida]